MAGVGRELAECWAFMVCGSNVPAPFFAQRIERGVPIDGVRIGEVLLEGREGAGASEDERGDSEYFLGGEVAAQKIVLEAAEDDADKNSFLGEINVFGSSKKGGEFGVGNATLVVAVGDGVGIAFRRAGKAGMGSTAWGVCA